MDVQSVFYTLGSIFMILGIIILIGVGVLLWKGYQTLQKAQEGVASMKENISGKIMGFISSRPGEVASVVGMGLSSFLLSRVKNFFKKKARE
jgi:hypothetical protein